MVKVGLDDGIMQTLCAKDIAYCASNIGNMLDGFDFGIQPRAREALGQDFGLMTAL